MSKKYGIFSWDLKTTQEKNLIRWIEALISGRYKQCRGRLYNPKTGCHCANGVLLREFGFNEINGWFYFGFDADSIRFLGNKWLAPQKWRLRTLGSNSQINRVAGYNDFGHTFAEIAAILVEILPDSKKKAELQLTIADKLKAERAVREFEQGVHQ